MAIIIESTSPIDPQIRYGAAWTGGWLSGRWMTRPGSCTAVLWYSRDTGERRDGFQARTRANPCGQDT